jgi:hypothetical protein
MTKTEMRRLAQQSTRYGFFDYGAKLAVDCPLCRKHVEVVYSMWTTDGKGKRLSKIQQVRAEVFEHLKWEHNTESSDSDR